MTHRLPIPGSDDGQWGDILNDFLNQAHNADGSIKTSVLAAKANVTDLTALAPLASPALTGTPTINGSAVTSRSGARPVGQGELAFNIKDYGAVGDGTTNDSSAIQAAINAATAAGGGIVLIPPASYVLTTGLSIAPLSLTSQLAIYAYGAKLTYNGSADALLINTNILASDIQAGERIVSTYGLHIVGSSAAASGIRNYGCSRCSFRDTTLEGFTSTTAGHAAVVLDARYDYWVEENHFDGLEIKNTGNGICFISENDVSSVPASCENNVFSVASIWLTQTGGKGVYGLGRGGSAQVLLSRSVFTSVVMHPNMASGITGYDFGACACDGMVLVAPAMDIVGPVSSLTFFNYSGTSTLVVLGAKADSYTLVTTFFGGGGKYLVLGGNAPTSYPFSVDSTGNITAATLTLAYDIYDANGRALIHQVAGTSAVNHLSVGNSATGSAPYLTLDGTDTNIGLSLYGKGSGVVSVNGSVPLPTPATIWSQLAVPGITTSLSTAYSANIMGFGQIQVTAGTYLTGISFYNSGTISGNVIVALFSSTGALLASSTSTAQAGSYTMQSVAFSTGYAAAAGTYYIGVMPSSGTATFAQNCCYGLSGAAAPGSFIVPSSITVPTARGSYIISASTY